MASGGRGLDWGPPLLPSVPPRGQRGHLRTPSALAGTPGAESARVPEPPPVLGHSPKDPRSRGSGHRSWGERASGDWKGFAETRLGDIRSPRAG